MPFLVLIYQKFHMEWLGIEPQPPHCKTGNSLPQPGHNPVQYVQGREVVNIYTGLSKN